MKMAILDLALEEKYQKGHKEGYGKAMNFTVKNYSAVVLLCLQDKYDFTPDQLKEVSKHIADTFDSVCKGYLSLSDIATVLLEESNIDISFDRV